MTFATYFIKLQFKLDHVKFVHRLAICVAALVSIVTLWWWGVYLPQVKQVLEVQQNIKQLHLQNVRLSQRNARILAHIKKQDMAPLFAQYAALRAEERALDKKMEQYQSRYIDDKALAALLHGTLKDIGSLKVEHFSTLVPTDVADADPKGAPHGDAVPHGNAAPLMTHYALSLRGDYVSMIKFLKGMENLKWQLFCETLTYHVEKYP